MLRRIFSYFHQYRKYLVVTVICVVAESFFELVIPLMMADIVDVGVANGDTSYIIHKGLQMVGCAILALLLGIGSARFAALSGQGLGAELRKEEYRRLQAFSFSNIDHFQLSSLVTRLTSDVTSIQNSVSSGLRPVCRSPVMLFVATGMAFSINRNLAMVFLVALPVLGFLLFWIIFHVRPLYTRMQTAMDAVNRIVQENLTAIRVVKAYVRGDYETLKFAEVNDHLTSQSEKAFRLASLNMPALQFVMYGTILSILWFGGGMVQVGTMKVGELTGILSYVMQILNSMMMLSGVFMMVTRSLASARRIVEVLDEEPEITDQNAREIQVERGEITFDHVYFKYNREAPEYLSLIHI